MLTENMPLAEHWTQWIARKCHRTHFRDRVSRSSYQPRTNTDVLYDGSVEARAILGPTFEGDITEEGAGVRRHALDYLKGRDVPLMGMWTKEIMDEDETVIEEDLTELEKTTIQNMVMDRSAVVTEEEPKLVQIAPVAEYGCESGRFQCTEPNFTEVDKGEPPTAA